MKFVRNVAKSRIDTKEILQYTKVCLRRATSDKIKRNFDVLMYAISQLECCILFLGIYLLLTDIAFTFAIAHCEWSLTCVHAVEPLFLGIVTVDVVVIDAKFKHLRQNAQRIFDPSVIVNDQRLVVTLNQNKYGTTVVFMSDAMLCVKLGSG